MNFEKQLQVTMIWLASLACFFAGLYVALDHTLGIFTHYNYLFAPLGDEGTDAATSIYPILTGKKPFISILEPFADHRVIFGRLQEMFDFVYTQGMQPIQPYRLALLSWLNVILFVGFIIFKNPALDNAKKILLTGAYLALVFAGISFANYNSTMMTTWPYVLLFGLVSFIFTQQYCVLIIKDSSSKKSLIYLSLTFLFVTFAVLTFNIGLILWPIVFVILFKQKCFKKHWYLWSLALLTYPLYFYHWIPSQGSIGVREFWQHPIHVFLYMSRILSLPIVPSALTAASPATVAIASFVVLFSLLFLYSLLKKKTWSTSDAVLFAYFLFGILSVCCISAMRFWMTGEAISIGTRFTTASFIVTACLLVSFFSLQFTSSKDQLSAQTITSMAVMVWLVSLFNMSDPVVVYDGSMGNQMLISEATGTPIDEGFIKGTSGLHNLYDVTLLNYLNDVQKQYKKGVYAFWSAQYMNRSINDLHFKKVVCSGEADIKTSLDFRNNHNPGIFINIVVKNFRNPLTENWHILFSSPANTIVGFGISGPAYVSLRDRFKKNTMPYLLFRGAINSSLLNNKTSVTAWAADDRSQQLCKLGEIKI